ncbi:hypothetical protein EZI54_14900 [Marinobacter halodurans]|uniref:DUF2550 family protein n=1 Tax=Marinobacter halodurans TaxID=2528979 RepID=A0ABY1ZLW9_9GAMM|nr:hypothetical protein [Marinobacter halodurans]TBW53778.1 hypothetical protein EZI54_14900 [Marinobacter halodurans]
MSNPVALIVIALVAIGALMLFQARRRNRSMAALRRQGFVPGQRWSSSLTVVTEQGTDRFAVVWPGRYQIFRAAQIVSIDVIGQEMESAQHRHKVQIELDDPEHQAIGLATLNRRDRAERWAREIREWRASHVADG